MAVPDLAEPAVTAETIAVALRDSSLIVVQVDLRTLRVIYVSPAAADALGVSPSDAVGRPVSDWIEDVAHGGLPLLATGRLDGFEAGRYVRRPDGSQIRLYGWVHVLGDERPSRHAIVIGSREGAGGLSLRSLDSGRVVGTVDAVWRVDRISHEVRDLLGHSSEAVVGAPILAAVHPNDVPDLLGALALTHRNRRGVALQIRLLTAAQDWRPCRVHLVGLDETPSFAFVAKPLAGNLSGGDLHQQLRRRLEDLAHEVGIAASAVPAVSAPTVVELPELAQLTNREWEVVARLVHGKRVPTIAKDLGVSASTIRNHLSSTFSKLGVGSQAELLERMREPTPVDAGTRDVPVGGTTPGAPGPRTPL